MPLPIDSHSIVKLSEEQRASVLRFFKNNYSVRISAIPGTRRFAVGFNDGSSIDVKGTAELYEAADKMDVDWPDLINTKANQLGAVSAIVGREKSVKMMMDLISQRVADPGRNPKKSIRNLSFGSQIASASKAEGVQMDVFGDDYSAMEKGIDLLVDSPSIREKLADISLYPFSDERQNWFVKEFFSLTDSLGIDWYHKDAMPNIEKLNKPSNVLSVASRDPEVIRDGLVSYLQNAASKKVSPSQALSNLHSKMYQSELSLDIERTVYAPDLESVGYPPYMFSGPAKKVLSFAYQKALGGASADKLKSELSTIVAYHRPLISRGEVKSPNDALIDKAKQRASVAFNALSDRLVLAGAEPDKDAEYKKSFTAALSLNGSLKSGASIQGWSMGLQAAEGMILGVSPSTIKDGVNPKSIKLTSRLQDAWGSASTSMNDIHKKLESLQPVINDAFTALSSIEDRSSLELLKQWSRHFEPSNSLKVSPWLNAETAQIKIDELTTDIPAELFEANFARVKDMYKSFGGILEEHAKTAPEWAHVSDMVRRIVPIDPASDFENRMRDAVIVAIASSILEVFKNDFLPGIREERKRASEISESPNPTPTEVKSKVENPESAPVVSGPASESAGPEPALVTKVESNEKEPEPVATPVEESEIKSPGEVEVNQEAPETVGADDAPNPSHEVDKLLAGKKVSPSVRQAVELLYGPPPEDLREGLEVLYDRVTDCAMKNNEPHLTDEFEWLHKRWMSITKVDIDQVDNSALPVLWDELVQTFGPIVATKSDKKIIEWCQNDYDIQSHNENINALMKQLSETFANGEFPKEHVHAFTNAIEAMKAPISYPNGQIAANVSSAELISHATAVEESIQDFIFTAPEDQAEHLAAVISELRTRDNMHQLFLDAAQEGGPKVANALAEHFEAMYKDPTHGLVLKHLVQQNEKVDYLVSDPAIFDRLKNSKDRTPNSSFFEDYRKIGEDHSELYGKYIMDTKIPGFDEAPKAKAKPELPELDEAIERPRLRA